MNAQAPNTGEQPEAKLVMKDKNGKEITKGMHVVMPEPTVYDSWAYGDFVAYVQGFEGEESELLLVVDGDGDLFVVEPERVEISED